MEKEYIIASAKEHNRMQSLCFGSDETINLPSFDLMLLYLWKWTNGHGVIGWLLDKRERRHIKKTLKRHGLYDRYVEIETMYDSLTKEEKELFIENSL